MARSSTVKNSNDGTLQVLDGTSGTPLEVSGMIDQGDFTASGLRTSETEAYEARGVTTSHRKTTRNYPSGSFTVQFKEFSESTVGTLLDLLYGTSGTPFASRVSTGRVPGDVIHFDLKLTVEGTDFGDAADHVLTFQDCELVPDFSEGSPNTLTVNWTCYGDVAGDLSILAPS